MDCTVTPLKTLMVFSVHLNVQLKFYNLPYAKATNTKREIIKYGLIKIELNKNVDFLILGC